MERWLSTISGRPTACNGFRDRVEREYRNEAAGKTTRSNKASSASDMTGEVLAAEPMDVALPMVSSGTSENIITGSNIPKAKNTMVGRASDETYRSTRSFTPSMTRAFALSRSRSMPSLVDSCVAEMNRWMDWRRLSFSSPRVEANSIMDVGRSYRTRVSTCQSRVLRRTLSDPSPHWEANATALSKEGCSCMLMDIAPITVGDSRSMSSSSRLAPEEGEPMTRDGTMNSIRSSGTMR